MTQTVLSTCRGVKISIDPGPSIAMSQLVVLRNLMAIEIADENTHPDVKASLRYARTHVLQAIRHQAARSGVSL